MIKNDKLIVIDLEATCWEKDPPEGQQSDIIEIGLAVLNIKNGDIEDKASYVIKPERSTVGPFCEKLTGWSQDTIDRRGMKFETAISYIRKTYDTKNRAWASYGDYDRKMLVNQCQYSEVAYPFSKQHLNVKEMVNVFNGGVRMIALGRALEKVGLQFIGVPHNGEDDAYNIARLIRELMFHGRKKFK